MGPSILSTQGQCPRHLESIKAGFYYIIRVSKKYLRKGDNGNTTVIIQDYLIATSFTQLAQYNYDK